MATSMFYKRTLQLGRTLKGISFSKSLCVKSQGGPVFQAAFYNPKPLKLNLWKPYIPDKNSEKTPEWQKTAHYEAKLFGRYGTESGINPASLWPTHEQLDQIIADEKEWQPSLETMLKNIQARDKVEREKRLAKEKIIAANMAKMPKMVADWRKEKRETKQKLKEEKARRETLLAQARERFGFTVDPRSPKFLEMVAEIEKEEKKKKKLLKRRLREEQVAAQASPITPPTSS